MRYGTTASIQALEHDRMRRGTKSSTDAPMAGNSIGVVDDGDSSYGQVCFNPSFTLIINTSLYLRDDPLRGMPIVAHHTAFHTILVTTSNIPLHTHSHGSFTRSVSIDRHPGWRQIPSDLAPPPTFLLQKR